MASPCRERNPGSQPGEGPRGKGLVRSTLTVNGSSGSPMVRTLVVALSRARDAPLNRICRIAESRRRWMAGRHQAIDQRLVYRRKLMIERGDVAVPLRLGAWARDSGRHKRVVEHPQYGELLGGHAALLGVLLDRLREVQ